MSTFKGVINGVAYNNEEDFKNAFSNLDMTKPYNISFSSAEETEMCNKKSDENKCKGNKEKTATCVDLYPSFGIDELSKDEMTEDFIKALADKLEDLIKYSKGLDKEDLEAHLTNLRKIKDSWHDRLSDTNKAYNKILSRVEDLQEKIDSYEDQIENQNNKLDYLNNSLDYIEAISQFYEDYLYELEKLSKPLVEGHVAKEQIVSKPRVEVPVETSSKQVKEQKEVDLDDRAVKAVRNLIDALFPW